MLNFPINVFITFGRKGRKRISSERASMKYRKTMKRKKNFKNLWFQFFTPKK